MVEKAVKGVLDVRQQLMRSMYWRRQVRMWVQMSKLKRKVESR